MSSFFSVISTVFCPRLKVGGKLHPLPKKSAFVDTVFLVLINVSFSFHFYPPIFTVGHPTTITPPCAVLSPILAAGFPPIITVPDPAAIVSGGPVQVSMSPTLAAGWPPNNTVGQPGGITGPPTCGTVPVTNGQVCISPTLAADGIVLIYIYH
jgi:hypothetical protein